ncbi:MAG: MarR family winged helix-turn-helix transcriptional regulator [Alteraurantiacibacter sp.]
MIEMNKSTSGREAGEAVLSGEPGASSAPLTGWSIDQLDFPTFRIGLVAKIMDRMTIRQLLDQDSLSYAEWRVLARLMAMTEGGTIVQVAELAWVDPGEVSRAVNSLEHKQLVARQKSPTDGRVSIMTLTDEGREQYRKTLSRRHEFHESLLAGLSAHERAQLDKLLGRIGERLAAML